MMSMSPVTVSYRELPAPRQPILVRYEMKVVTWAALACSILSLLCALLLTTRMSTAMGPAPVVNATHYAQLAGTASDDSTRDHSLAARND